MGKEVIKHTFKFKEQRRTIYLNAASKDEYGRHRGHVLYGMKLTPDTKVIRIGPGALYTPWGTKIFLDVTDPLTAGLMEIDLTEAVNLPGGVAPDVLDPQYFTNRPIVLAVVCKFDNYTHGFNSNTPDPSGNLPVSEEIGQDKQDNQASWQQISELEVQRNLTFIARPVTWDRINVAPDFNFIALEPIFMNRDPQTEADPSANIYDVRRNYGSASVAPVGSGASVDGSSIAYDEILLGYVIIGAPLDGEVAGPGLTIVGAGGSGGTTSTQFIVSPSGALQTVVPGQYLNVTGSTNCLNDGAFTIISVDPDTGIVEVSEAINADTIGSATITAAGNDLPQTLGTPNSGWAPGVACIQGMNVWESLEDFLGRDVLMGRNTQMVTSSPAEATDNSVPDAPVDVPTSALHQVPGQFNIGLPGVDALALTTLMLAPKYGTTNIDPSTGAFAANWSNYRLPSFMKDGDSLIWVMRRLDYILRLWMDRTGDQELIGLIQDGTGIGQTFMSPLYKILKNFNGSDGTADAESNLNKILYADNGDLYDLPDDLFGTDPNNRVLKSGPMPHRDFQNPNINTVLGTNFGDNHLGALKALDVAIWNVLENILGTTVVRSLLRTTASWDQNFFNDLPINIATQPPSGNFTGNATSGYVTASSKLFAAVTELMYRTQRNCGDNLLRNHSFWAVDQATNLPKFWNKSAGTLTRNAIGLDDFWSMTAALPASAYFEQTLTLVSFDASSVAAAGNLISASITLKNDQALKLQIIGWDGAAEQLHAEVSLPISTIYRTVSLTTRAVDTGDTTVLIFRVLNSSGIAATVVCLGASLNAGMPNAEPVTRIAADFLSRDGGADAAMRGDLYMGGNAIRTGGGEIFTGGAQIHGENASAEGTDPYDFVTLSQLTSYTPTIGGDGSLGSWGTAGSPKTVAQTNALMMALYTDGFGHYQQYLQFTEAHITGDGTRLLSPLVIRCTGDLHLYGEILMGYQQYTFPVYEDYLQYSGAEFYLSTKTTTEVIRTRHLLRTDPFIHPAINLYNAFRIPFAFLEAFSGESYGTGDTSVAYRRYIWESAKPPIILKNRSLSGGGGGGTGKPAATVRTGFGCMGGWGSINTNTTPTYREVMYGAGGLGIPSMDYGSPACVFKPAFAGYGGNGSSISVAGAPGPLLGGTGGRGGGTFIALVDGNIYHHGGGTFKALGENGSAPPQAAYVKSGKAYNGSGGGGGGGGQVGLLSMQSIIVEPGFLIDVRGGIGGDNGGGVAPLSDPGGGGGGGCVAAMALNSISGTVGRAAQAGTSGAGASPIQAAIDATEEVVIAGYKVYLFPFGGQ